MEETKNEINNNLDIQVKEERRKIIDNRRQVMQSLELREDHPYFIQVKDELEKLPIDWQILFYPKIKEQCNIYDEEYREFTKTQRIKQKLLDMRNKRKKQQYKQEIP